MCCNFDGDGWVDSSRFYFHLKYIVGPCSSKFHFWGTLLGKCVCMDGITYLYGRVSSSLSASILVQ